MVFGMTALLGSGYLFRSNGAAGNRQFGGVALVAFAILHGALAGG
jgi:hypothetical protein